MGGMSGRRLLSLLLVGLILLCGDSIGVVKAGKSTSANRPAIRPAVRLFGTLEFKGTLKKLPKWTGVLKRMQMWKGYFRDRRTASLPARAGWFRLQKEIQGLPLLQQLTRVNRFFNQWPYRLDQANYGVRDYWATPAEFLQRSGDCEDYAIAKFYALKELNLPNTKMRIVAIRDAIRNIGHAILAVYAGNTVYILDNQTNMVLPHTKYRHYVPQYSVNEHYRWMHIPQKKKKKKKNF